MNFIIKLSYLECLQSPVQVPICNQHCDNLIGCISHSGDGWIWSIIGGIVVERRTEVPHFIT